MRNVTDDKCHKKRKANKGVSMHSGTKLFAVPNAPSLTRLPLPRPKYEEVQAKLRALKEAAICTKLGHADPPSICFYTILNTKNSCLCAVSISDDASLLAGSCGDSVVRVYSLTDKKLRSIKSAPQSSVIPPTAAIENVMESILDSSCNDMIKLTGHSGPVYSTSFNPDNSLLLSSSEDGTVRMWSLLTFTTLVCFRGHNYPVWAVEFSPLGFYFCTSSYDHTARVWSTNHIQPLRILAGHYSDVQCLKFHPNGNYVATGSNDLTVRLWDIPTGECVRLFTGHKASIQVLSFTPDGRYLVSSGVDCIIRIMDVSSAKDVCQFEKHQATIYSLTFSRDGSVLVSGGMDNQVVVWDTAVFQEEHKQKNASSEGFVNRYATKSTAVQLLHFTRQNLLLAVGAYNSS